MKVRLTAYTDRTFKFIIKPPETTWFLKRITGLPKFTPMPGVVQFGYVELQSLYQVAKIKKYLDPDMKHVDMEQILDVIPITMQMIVSQLTSCGLNVLNDEDVESDSETEESESEFESGQDVERNKL